jgi:methylglutaconyl-CoA hydratase
VKFARLPLGALIQFMLDVYSAMRRTEPFSHMTNTLEVRQPSPYVAEVWLNRPEVRNAFNADMVAELTRTFRGLGSAPDLRAIVLGGHGKAFCAGGDLAWMEQTAGYTWEENRADAQALADMVWTIYSCPVPVVGRIHGDCYAGGVGLAAACDVMVVSDNVHFCLSEVKLGLVPGTVSPYVMRAMGEHAARRYILTGERFSAAHAHHMGFAHEVCALEAIDDTVATIVAALRANGPMATRACKQLVQDVAGAPITAALRENTAQRIASIRASSEGVEGMQSFLNKRKPNWVE